MDTWDAALLVFGVLWLLATIGFLLSILIELARWLWTGRKGMTVTVEEEREP